MQARRWSEHLDARRVAGKVAVVGVYTTNQGKRLGRSKQSLELEAIKGVKSKFENSSTHSFDSDRYRTEIEYSPEVKKGLNKKASREATNKVISDLRKMISLRLHS